MLRFAIVSVLILQMGWCCAAPSDGVGAFAYQDSTGNRRVARSPTPWFPPLPPLPPLPGMKPFKPLRLFDMNLGNQQFDSESVQKAFSPNSNYVGYVPPLDRMPIFQEPDSFEDLGGGAGAGASASAVASAVLTPDFSRQVAAIDPINPMSPNVDVIDTFEDDKYAQKPRRPKIYAVSSKSMVSASNINGRTYSHREAETMVNKDGKVSGYRVTSD